MNECSLCKEPLQPEGGAILFTDYRGKPFEICGTCEKMVDLLRNSTDEQETQTALNYISENADNVEYRDTYDALFAFIKQDNPELPSVQEEKEKSPTESIEDEMEAVTSSMPESIPSTKRKFWIVAVGIVVVGILVLVYVLVGFHLGG